MLALSANYEQAIVEALSSWLPYDIIMDHIVHPPHPLCVAWKNAYADLKRAEAMQDATDEYLKECDRKLRHATRMLSRETCAQETKMLRGLEDLENMIMKLECIFESRVYNYNLNAQGYAQEQLERNYFE